MKINNVFINAISGREVWHISSSFSHGSSDGSKWITTVIGSRETTKEIGTPKLGCTGLKLFLDTVLSSSKSRHRFFGLL